MSKLAKRIASALLAAVMAATLAVTVNAATNTLYQGTYSATSTSYIEVDANNCTLNAVKQFDSGTRRYVNATNPSSYYCGNFDTATRGFNATFDYYYQCDGSGANPLRISQSLIIIADSTEIWYNSFNVPTHLLINYHDLTYIKTL